jgi:putative tryptophan/tyrosine transport system substrate-binding protein
MRRREFIAGISATAWPLAVRGQQPGGPVRRIGVLMSTANDSDGRLRIAAFRRRLQESGWTDESNAQIELHWGNGNTDLVQRYAEQLARVGTDVLLAGSTAALVALRNRTKTIPIVFAQVSDPVGQGYVESLARPGGNITGFTNFESTMTGKWLELLKQVAPGIRSAALMFNPDTAPYFDYYVRSVETSALSLSVKTAPVHNIVDIETALSAFGGHPDAGLVVLPDTFMTVNRKLIISLVIHYRIPAVYTFRYFAAEGGLISYGSVTDDLFSRAGSYVDRILRGEQPADLPVQQPTKFELVINLKTSKSLGLTIPPNLLALADEVIE